MKRLPEADKAGRAMFVAAYAALRAGARPTGAKHFFVDETHFNAARARTISPPPRAARPLQARKIGPKISRVASDIGAYLPYGRTAESCSGTLPTGVPSAITAQSSTADAGITLVGGTR